jgi:hypothetical protein
LAPARPDRAVAQGGRNVPATVRRRHTEKAAYWLDFCRRYIIKQADLGGDGQDLPFEQAFSNLAHAYLRDKAPGLLDYEVGFQLVDRNEDNSKAIGISTRTPSSLVFASPISRGSSILRSARRRHRRCHRGWPTLCPDLHTRP